MASAMSVERGRCDMKRETVESVKMLLFLFAHFPLGEGWTGDGGTDTDWPVS